MPQNYPVFLNIEKKNCLVVGGGSVACRKVGSLLECGAWVEVVSPKVEPSLKELADKGVIRLMLRAFEEGDENGRFLVFAATGDHFLNQRIARLCREKNIWLNAVDDPENCDFYVPAVLRRGDVAAAVSTSGKSPLLAAAIRDEIGKILPEEMGTLAQILGEVRERVNRSSLSPQQRKALYTSLLQQDFLTLLQQGKEEAVREKVEQCIFSWLD